MIVQKAVNMTELAVEHNLFFVAFAIITEALQFLVFVNSIMKVLELKVYVGFNLFRVVLY
jgi:hypothetical protein